ncbi:MAG TPA: 50S ribosomal protein L44e [Candidatus Syntrophoarchaeum butanivorans]|uniref:Large ribosomal subunit protein eL42 n=1 Tax=Candidatus Syntropharchaeum butanivorans TaxID=1839936 RepID=A0A7C1B2N1_9EURY|nr:50S ribosomal protein L44e [Candidatus Syntrophoarchaeum butanivorans]HEC56448.1 50S ribosomal protein L44e [Candidatus Syntrophoarchaeum butanivorans]
MKMPKEIRMHCPYCNKHTLHEVVRVKKRRPSSLTHIARQKKRQSGIGNSGKFSKVPGGDKPTKRVELRYHCTECSKAHTRPCFRASKFELVEY